MRKNYVLIDYENVQPDDFVRLHGKCFRVKLFLGPTQVKIPLEVARALQPLGADVEYIKLNAGGSNALDFHIAYTLGVLTTQEPEAHYHVVSKDTGFDSLIGYLRTLKIGIGRCQCISDIPCLMAASAPVRTTTTAAEPSDRPAPTSAPAKPKHAASGKKSTPAAAAARLKGDVQLALAHLSKMKAARPRKLKTLQSTLQTLFKADRTPEEVEAIIKALTAAGRIVCDSAKVSYDI